MVPSGGRLTCWDGHVLLAYATEAERRAGVVAWIRRGLETGAKTVYVESAREPVERSLMRVLSEVDVDVSGALRDGRLQVVDPSDGYGVVWQTNLVEAGLNAGYPAVRLGGDASTAWSVMSQPDHAQAERAADELCRSRPASMLCQYSTDVTASVFEQACTMHSGGIREWKLRTAPFRGGVALDGEIDLSNVHVLRSAVAAACDTTDPDRGSVIVDLARLDFLDVAGARALLTGSASFRSSGGLMRLQSAVPQVDRFLRQLGMDRYDGVVLEDGS